MTSSASHPERTIELGWLLPDDLPRAQHDAVRAAREILAKTLGSVFPRFDWRMPVVARAFPSVLVDGLDEPAARLHDGVEERDARAWDFAFVVTPHDLRSHYKSYALAVPSRALAVAVLSLARLAPSDASDHDSFAHRIANLALHLLGDLNGIWHREEPGAAMAPPEAVTDLDEERGFDADERRALGRALDEVADLRLEESAAAALGAWPFYLRASWHRAGEIASAVLQARPWELPLRLSRLTAAAMSAMLVLLLTAEAWDLGTHQPPAILSALSAGVLATTTAFVLLRQKLLLRRSRARISEQSVVTNVSATLIVAIGLLTTYAVLFLLTLGVGLALFDAALIGRWAPDVASTDVVRPVLGMAALVSSLGLLIGSLGASFEGQQYFRHVIYADEET